MSAPGPKITLQLDPEAQAAVTEEDLPAPIPLHPFSIERIGKRRGFQALKACAAGHTLEVFACAHVWRLFAELDGRRLIRARKRRRPYRHYSKDPLVRRWILAKAGEFDGPMPAWTCKEIAANLRCARRAIMSDDAVSRLLWRVAPGLARRRLEYWRCRWKHQRQGGRRNKTSPGASQG